MKIAFDTTTAAFAQKTGTGVYCEELVKAYQSRFCDDQITHSYRITRWFKGGKYLLPLSENAQRSVLLDPVTYFNGYSFEIFHGLNTRLPLMGGCKKIATVHDLFSIFGQFSDSRFIEDQSKKLKLMINRADHIIVPATFTKNQLVEKMGLSAERISVVGEGVRQVYLQSKLDNTFQNELREKSLNIINKKFKILKPYILFVGTLEKRKNILGLIKVFEKLNAKLSNNCPDLVLVGSEGFGFEEIKKTIESSAVKSKIKRLGFVNEAELSGLYRGCSTFVFLSHEEGYGIPVIEAMACGASVLTSNTTSLPEVGGGYTWLVDPLDVDHIVIKLVEILSQSEAVIQQVKRGQAYASGLTWTKVAEDTRRVYEKILQKSI